MTSCAGCQLAIINCEDELLDLVELIDIKQFVMASSDVDEECELDVAFVEGAVVTERDEQTLRHIRHRSSLLIALGTCATWGGIAKVESLEKYVKVDGKITGCPIEKHEFLSAVANLLRGQLPVFAHYPVCVECKMRENECLLLGSHQFCSGPVTVAGCDARCTSLGVACIGCRGPAPDANYESAMKMYAQMGFTERDIKGRLSSFAVGAV